MTSHYIHKTRRLIAINHYSNGADKNDYKMFYEKNEILKAY